MQTKFELGEKVWIISDDGNYEVIKVVIDRMDLFNGEVGYSGCAVDDINWTCYLKEDMMFATKEEAILASIRVIAKRVTELQALAKQRQEELEDAD